MGFWGTLGKIAGVAGSIAGSFIPGGSLAVKGISSVGSKILGGLSTAGKVAGAIGVGAGAGALAGKAIKDLSAPDPYAELLKSSGQRLTAAGTPAYEQALSTYGKLASGDKNELTAFTGTGTNELNRVYTNQINKASTQMNRGGAQSKVLAEAPGALERDALALRLNTRSNALDKLGSLGLSGTQAGNQAFSAAGGLGLDRRGQNIRVAEDLGQGVGSILDKTGVWDKLGAGFGKIFGGGSKGSSSGDLPGFSDTNGPGAPSLPEFKMPSEPSFTSAGLGEPINLDMFGGKGTVPGSSSMGPLERRFSPLSRF